MTCDDKDAQAVAKRLAEEKEHNPPPVDLARYFFALLRDPEC